MNDYAAYDNFGLQQLSVCDAARLIVTDMWFMGTHFSDVSEPPDYDGSPDDPALLEALNPEIQKFERKLIAAINSKNLEASRLLRDFDENIVKEETLIHYSDLEVWLLERGYQPGDAFAEWLEKEGDIHSRLADEASFLRETLGRKEPMSLFMIGAKLDIDMLEEPESLRQAAKALLIENKRLEAELETLKKNMPHDEKPLHPKRRRSYLKVIAILFEKLEMDLGKPGMAKIIERWSESSNLSKIDEDTIKGILDEAREG